MDLSSGVDYAEGGIIGVDTSDADHVKYNVRADGTKDNQAQWIEAERISAIDAVHVEKDRPNRLTF